MIEKLRAMRAALEAAFGDDTRAPGSTGTGSAGHCAAVAVIVRRHFGGYFVSATVGGQSHWFNRIDGKDYDLTGDQFGRPPLQFFKAGELYTGTRVRDPGDCKAETVRRARLLAERAGLHWHRFSWDEEYDGGPTPDPTYNCEECGELAPEGWTPEVDA